MINSKVAKRIRNGAKALEAEAVRRKRAEDALGRKVDDLTYERLVTAKSWADIYRIAQAHDDLDIWNNQTLQFLHLAAKPTKSERYFLRTMKALRRSVTET
jgi:hypothetical protein